MITCMCLSCAKDEVLPVDKSVQQAGVLMTRVASSDVYVENGYLVVKDLDALDALENKLGEMSDMERLAWERQIGFESASTYFKPYFDAFDALEEETEMIAFQERHKDVVRVWMKMAFVTLNILSIPEVDPLYYPKTVK